MTELSPAAQAVRKAAINAKPGHTIPAALRAAVDQVEPDDGVPSEVRRVLDKLQTIAAELDGTQPTSENDFDG